jgi:phosphatidylserine/phosphatidylglycerophosphate/cardiolipin synthase-like enzyme
VSKIWPINQHGFVCGARPRIAASLLLAFLAPGRADPAAVIHYAPGENLEHADVALIESARHEIDMAAYVLTDWPVMQALTRAADRGVAIRIYLDGAQFSEREPAKVFHDLPRRLASRLETRDHRPDAPQELPNRRAVAAHRRRELFRVRPQAAGQRLDSD